MAQATKKDVDMDLANTQTPPQRSASSMTSERGKSPSNRKSSPARLMGQHFAHYPPQVTRHDTRNSRRAAEAAGVAAPTHEEGPRESRWDPSHRPSNKKSTSPGRTKQAAVEGMDAARHQARATTVDSKCSTSRNAKVRASATTAQPTRKAGDRGQSPHKTMRTEETRGVATKLPWQHPIDRDDPSDAANAAYDACFNATDVDEDVSATFHEAMQSADATGYLLEACKKEIGNLEAMECYELSQVGDLVDSFARVGVLGIGDMSTQLVDSHALVTGQHAKVFA
ncbi:hypothetical protein H257_17798 [Aphanomyces astaci]|uniref:Uncharacterized protein n=1 Tax=Aphanomyces astaci TaxID=112090 RepID=W4FDA4_APHAT|nr:hypothetical protein H257_17798 [Aphanomyces astaci]ETV65462.1 hypothetical protein H257_17798 [Aphanomyces astaci]|eukprot:XP_009845044.1 hypothetical protein H257_17798 [Aphanomyces astaci]